MSFFFVLQCKKSFDSTIHKQVNKRKIAKLSSSCNSNCRCSWTEISLIITVRPSHPPTQPPGHVSNFLCRHLLVPGKLTCDHLECEKRFNPTNFRGGVIFFPLPNSKICRQLQITMLTTTKHKTWVFSVKLHLDFNMKISFV